MTELDENTNEQHFFNCEMEFKCPKDWFALLPTDKAEVKFCEACQHNVYLCLTEDQLRKAIDEDKCIAYFEAPSMSTRFSIQQEKVGSNRQDPNFEPIVVMGLPRRKDINGGDSANVNLIKFIEGSHDKD